MAHDRTFRFGVMCSHADGGADFADKARRAEALGYSTLFVPDHFVDHQLAPIAAMAAAAAVTTTLRVGSLVLGNDYKHPVVLAREAATIDYLSDGRLELGIGAGWMTADYEKSGIPLDRPGVRIARLAESIAVLKGLFADGPFTFRGEHYQVTDLDGQPEAGAAAAPAVRDRRRRAEDPGAGGARGGDRRHQREPPGRRRGERGRGQVDDAGRDRREAGDAARRGGGPLRRARDPDFVGFTNFTDDRQGMAEAMAPSFGVPPDEAIKTPVILAGTLEQMIDDMLERRERWHMSYVVVGVDVMDQFAPAVAKLAGT